MTIHPFIVSIHVPARGTTKSDYIKATDRAVSIHVPARGTTISGNADYIKAQVSIHVPARGTTLTCPTCGQSLPVSIHVPARGTTEKPDVRSAFHIMFQSTFPHGERPQKPSVTPKSRCFNPRSRTGNDFLFFHGKTV